MNTSDLVKSIVAGCLLGALVLLAITCPHRSHINATAATNATAEEQTNTPPPQAAATSNFRLVITAEPTSNPNQQFSPPTNSVEVVSEEHLRQLQEQARKAHQQPQQTVQQ